MKHIVYVCMVAFVMISCQERVEFLDESVPCNTEVQIGNIYTISEDAALANLMAFLDDDNIKSRSSAKRVVESMYAVKYKGGNSRSAQDSVDCENLLYVANFENEQGYAILAGDKRISEPVIAIVDSGYLSDAVVYSAVELAQEERLLFEGFPITGPGLFTTPETGDELFMNPNTISLYVDSIQDTMVGNYDFSDHVIINGGGQALNSTVTTGGAISASELFSTKMCVNYAMGEIYDYIHWEPIQPLPDPIPDEGRPKFRIDTYYSPWEMTGHVDPLLDKFAKWRQSLSPFNDLTPSVRSLIIVGNKKNAPVGCFPLSIAKVMAYFQFPNNYKHGDFLIDWQYISQSEYSYLSTLGKTNIAHLLRAIGADCKSWYFYYGTFTFPSRATKFMRKINFANAHSYKYDFAHVKEMLDYGCPLIVFSCPGLAIWNSHAWNIDGYYAKERTITKKYFQNHTIYDIKEETETIEMVHCDFGWGGVSNGYYVSGLFKLGDESVELDQGQEHSDDKYNFNNFLKVIKYDKPI